MKNEIQSKCRDALERLGFNRPRKNCAYMPINEDFAFWVGLNAGSYDGYIDINPFVGLHAQKLSQMALEFSGFKYKKFDVATYAFHLGELAPDIKKFRFYRDSSEEVINHEADRLAREIISYGLPYLTQLASYDKILPLLKEREDMLGLYPQQVVTCLFWGGKREEAVDHANFLLEKYKNSESTGEQQVCDFAKRFISFVDSN